MTSPAIGSSPHRAALDDLANRLQAASGPARARQVRWIVRELDAYDILHAATVGRPALNLSEMLSTAYLRAYLDAADRGHLRTRKPTSLPSPVGAQKIRRACLHLLAAAAHLPPLDLPAAGGHRRPLDLAEADAARAMEALTAATRDESRSQRSRTGALRTALVASLVYEHGLRVAEIAALRLDDLGSINGSTFGPDTLIYTPRPQHGAHARSPVTIALARPTLPLLERWLPLRERLCAAHLDGAPTRALLVSVHPNHSGEPGGYLRPAGLPVMARGLARAHERAMDNLNSEFVERFGRDPAWTPLPTTLGSLRPRPAQPSP